MAALRFGGRTLATLAAAALGLCGCYATTPHRAEVASSSTPSRCATMVADVLTRSGFVQVARPPQLSMLFAARTTGPYSSFLTTGSGVGVMLTGNDVGSGWCHVTLEAVSPDASCPATLGGTSGTLNCQKATDPTPVVGGLGGQVSAQPLCPTVPQAMCELTYAPGAENDAAVDELARRVQLALGPAATVN